MQAYKHTLKTICILHSPLHPRCTLWSLIFRSFSAAPPAKKQRSELLFVFDLNWPGLPIFFHVNTFQAILHGTLVQPRGHGSKLFSPGFKGQKANAAAKTSSSQMRTSSSQIAGNCTLKLQRTQLLQLIHILCMRTSAFADNFFQISVDIAIHRCQSTSHAGSCSIHQALASPSVITSSSSRLMALSMISYKHSRVHSLPPNSKICFPCEWLFLRAPFIVFL